MEFHRKRFLLVYLIATAIGCNGEDDMSFFNHGDRSLYGTTTHVVASPILGDKGLPTKCLNISVEDRDAALVAVSVRSEYDIVDGVVGIGQPLVGILQWGVGGGQNQLEFDVPAPKYAPGITPVVSPRHAPMDNVGGGVNIVVQASHVSLNVRHDGHLAPLINVVQEFPNAPTDWIGAFTNPAKIVAFVGPGATQSAIVERTIYIAGGNVFPGLVTSEIAPGVGVDVSIPPFAKSVRFQRTGIQNSPLEVTMFANNALAHRNFVVPVNVEGPFPVDAATITMHVVNTGVGNITRLQAVFDVTPL